MTEILGEDFRFARAIHYVELRMLVPEEKERKMLLVTIRVGDVESKYTKLCLHLFDNSTAPERTLLSLVAP